MNVTQALISCEQIFLLLSKNRIFQIRQPGLYVAKLFERYLILLLVCQAKVPWITAIRGGLAHIKSPARQDKVPVFFVHNSPPASTHIESLSSLLNNSFESGDRQFQERASELLETKKRAFSQQTIQHPASWRHQITSIAAPRA
jgi:hypothetical protein